MIGKAAIGFLSVAAGFLRLIGETGNERKGKMLDGGSTGFQ